MRILVTGANGFVGAALCRKLAETGHQVRGLVRKTSDLSLLQGVTLELLFGSLQDAESLRIAAEGMDLVYHIAAAVTDWGTYDYFYEVNVQGTKRVLEASSEADVRRFIMVSSVAVHSFSGGQDMDEQAPQYPTPFPPPSGPSRVGPAAAATESVSLRRQSVYAS
jgi:nucleoside-diphosphate-sugar epimerase